jgi:glycosyltransferase involved in cell wall biosynthesis
MQISIIIPTYNVENYIRCALNSIINQWTSTKGKSFAKYNQEFIAVITFNPRR